MIEAQPFSAVFADCVGALGAGILLAVLYHLLRFFTGNSRIATPIRDILFAPVAALLCYSYAVTYSYAGILRFYILIFIGLGMLMYRQIVLKPLYSKERMVKRQVVVIVKKTCTGILHIVDVSKKCTITVVGRIKNSQILQRKQLRKHGKMLYNTGTSNHFNTEGNAKSGKIYKKKKQRKPNTKVGRLLSCGLPNIYAHTDPDTDKS